MRYAKPCAVASIALLLAACSDTGNETSDEAALTTVDAQLQDWHIPDQWLGRWFGPEGTYLAITKDGPGYMVAISDLDGPQYFRASADGAALRFERNGVVETITATDGEATGMKWLIEKNDCLTIKSGEGFCRD